MDNPLRSFIRQWLRVALAALLPVLALAFVSIPYSLNGHPGEARLAQPAAQRLT